MYLTWGSFNNMRMALMACMPVAVFYLVWLGNAAERVRSEEGALLDLVCWPDGNGIPGVIACAAVVAIVIELYGLYQLFKSGLPKREYNVTDGLFYYLWALIIMIIVFLAIMFYSGLQSTIIRAKIKGGITKAMLRYASHLPSKVAVDRLQTRFRCCGRDIHEEWFFIPWYTHGEKNNANALAQRKFVSDSVPYSCCSMDALRPCIHHGVNKHGDIYKYNPKELTIWKDGCEEKLINEMMTVSWRFNAVMSLIILAMILQVIAVRYLHTAYRNGLNIGNQIVSNAYLLRSLADVEARPARRMFYSSKRRGRTLHWVMGHGAATLSASAASGDDSSDELLRIDE